MRAEGIEETVNIFLQFVAFVLVGFGEDDAERNTFFTEPFDELKVDGLRRQARIDEYKEAGELLSLQNIVLYEVTQLLHRLFAALGIAVAGEVDQEPLVVDEEVVDEEGFPRRGGGHGQPFAPGEHVDERTLSDIAAADEGIFRVCAVSRALVGASGGDEEVGGLDDHD